MCFRSEDLRSYLVNTPDSLSSAHITASHRRREREKNYVGSVFRIEFLFFSKTYS